MRRLASGSSISLRAIAGVESVFLHIKNFVVRSTRVRSSFPSFTGGSGRRTDRGSHVFKPNDSSLCELPAPSTRFTLAAPLTPCPPFPPPAPPAPPSRVLPVALPPCSPHPPVHDSAWRPTSGSVRTVPKQAATMARRQGPQQRHRERVEMKMIEMPMPMLRSANGSLCAARSWRDPTGGRPRPTTCRPLAPPPPPWASPSPTTVAHHMSCPHPRRGRWHRAPPPYARARHLTQHLTGIVLPPVHCRTWCPRRQWWR